MLLLQAWLMVQSQDVYRSVPFKRPNVIELVRCEVAVVHRKSRFPVRVTLQTSISQ